MGRDKHPSNRQQQWRLGWICLAALVLSACGGRVTIGPVTFGNSSRTPATVVTVANTNPTPYANKSQNWAGYFLQTHNVTAVSATWQVPQVGSPANSDSSTWVGIGGVKNNSLIQAGTDQMMLNGKPYYFAWVELLPALPVQVKEIDLLPGDTMTVSITEQSTDNWHITFVDKDANESTTQSVKYQSCLCSAEWIEEAPSLKQKQATLASFTSVTFANLGATFRGQAIVPDQMCPFFDSRLPECIIPIRMVDSNGKTMVQPQTLQNGSFSAVDVRSATGASG